MIVSSTSCKSLNLLSRSVSNYLASSASRYISFFNDINWKNLWAFAGVLKSVIASIYSITAVFFIDYLVTNARWEKMNWSLECLVKNWTSILFMQFVPLKILFFDDEEPWEDNRVWVSKFVSILKMLSNHCLTLFV